MHKDGHLGHLGVPAIPGVQTSERLQRLEHLQRLWLAHCVEGRALVAASQTCYYTKKLVLHQNRA